MTIKTEANSVFRDFVTDGIPATGANEPSKSEVRALFKTINDAVDTINTALDTLEANQSSGIVGYETWAELEADTSQGSGAVGYVTADAGTHTDPVTAATVNNQGVYSWVDPTGWQRIADDVPFTDNDGKIDYGQTTAGLAMMQTIDGEQLMTVDPSAGPVVLDGDIPAVGSPRIIILYGQSNAAVGPSSTASIPAIHTSPLRKKRFFMFDDVGLISPQGVDIETYDLKKIVSAYEDGNETYSTGIVTQILAYQDAAGMIPQSYIVVNCALSSATYNQIKQGTQPYENIKSAISAIIKRHHHAVVECVVVDHGEDESATSSATYKGYIQQLYDNLQTDVSALSDHPEDFPLFMVQTPTLTTTGGGQGVQDAIISMHEDALASPSNRRIYAACGRYHSNYGDELHQRPAAMSRIGSLIGQSIAETLFGTGSGVFWMSSASKSGSVITVVTNAAYDLEEGSCPSGTPTGTTKGFIVTDSGGSPKAISTVEVSGTDITITLSVAAAIGDIVKYARDDINASAVGPGSWGLIRDTSPSVSALDPTIDVKQWMLACKVTVT